MQPLVLFYTLLTLAGCALCAYSQETTSVKPDRYSEMEENDLILLNVAAKGRVVELLANELARTEIIRALLVEYARECVENVTMLEKHCLSCMMNRCDNRRQECKIEGPPLSEMINHDPSPIQGVQFLSQTPRGVDEGMKKFASKARTDILQGVPETLRQQSEAIMHSEVDQSLKDLSDNINTEKTLKTISLHVQKAADNVQDLPKLGDKVTTIIIANEDHAISLAELLGKKLRNSRPFLDSINHNGARIMEKMPDVLDEVNERVQTFKEKMSGVFGRVMDTFQRVMDKPETPVMNENFPRGMVANQNGFPAPPMNPGQFQQGPGGVRSQQGFIQGGQFPGQVRQFPRDRLGQQQFFDQRMRQMQPQQGPGAPIHIPLSQTDIAGQRPGQMQSVAQGPGQFQQAMPIQGQTQNLLVESLSGQSRTGIPVNPSASPGIQTQNAGLGPNVQVQGPGQSQTFFGTGRRKRHTDPDCQRLKDDPDTYCRMFETQCHNCTLEKRLRFEVCGDGVEKARDEIKRMDESVAGYLKAYEEHIAPGPLVLKVELNDKNRLHKTNSYYDAYLTAKIGHSIFRYKTKMILNIDDIRATGSQVGDELWEKLWENEVLAEAKHVKLAPDTVNILGQAQEKDVHQAHAHKNSKGSSILGSFTSICVSFITFVVLFVL